jgi:serpin B
MKVALGVQGLTRDEMNEAYRGLLDVLPPLDPAVEVGIANSMWARQGFPLEEAFVERARSFFDARAEELDFADPGARDVINGWVDDMTHGRIAEIVAEIQSSDVLFLINAVYFKGDWTTRFDPAKTRTEPFSLGDGDFVDVPMMSAGEMPLGHYFGDGVAVADLPYGGGAYSMTLVVPWEEDLSSVLADLTRARWDGWIGELRKDTLPVFVPRFEMEFEAKLKDPLSRMGMGIAFTGAADFSDLTPVGVHIDRVVHKTFLKVDEKGSEAAAATSVVFQDSLASIFRADRPFLVAMRERLSGTILFLGAVYDPT